MFYKGTLKTIQPSQKNLETQFSHIVRLVPLVVLSHGLTFTKPQTSGAGLVRGRRGDRHRLRGAFRHPSDPHRQRRCWSVAGQWRRTLHEEAQLDTSVTATTGKQVSVTALSRGGGCTTETLSVLQLWGHEIAAARSRDAVAKRDKIGVNKNTFKNMLKPWDRGSVSHECCSTLAHGVSHRRHYCHRIQLNCCKLAPSS